MSRGAVCFCMQHTQLPAAVLLKSYSLNKERHPLKVHSVSLKLVLSDLLGAESLRNHQFNSLALKRVRALQAIGRVCADEDKEIKGDYGQPP